VAIQARKKRTKPRKTKVIAELEKKGSVKETITTVTAAIVPEEKPEVVQEPIVSATKG